MPRYTHFPVQVDPGRAYDYGIRSGDRACRIDAVGWRAGNEMVWWDPHSFDQQRSSGHQHEAADIMAPLGARVVAARPGRVLESWTYNGDRRPGAGYNDVAGHYVRIQADEGGTDQYSHLLHAPKVRPGERVRGGQLLGHVGQSGSAEGTCPHLHLSTRTASGVAVDMSNQLDILFAHGGWRAKPTGAVPVVAVVLSVVGIAAGTAAAFLLVRDR